ncbi:TPA: MFS transporter, partial [Klebsiella pneumoniae]|nr:MFS transporter [Klebsiella pneumoniae]
MAILRCVTAWMPCAAMVSSVACRMRSRRCGSFGLRAMIFLFRFMYKCTHTCYCCLHSSPLRRLRMTTQFSRRALQLR